jgi:hypothetical protein
MKRFLSGSILISTLATVSIFGADAPNLKEIEKRYGGPAVYVVKPKTAPVIDGQLDDSCWNQATPLALGHCAGMWWDPPTQKTEARILADDKAVYFAVRCFESQPERIVADGTVRKGTIEKADAVEFFLDPGLHRKRFDYFHYIVTAVGTIYRGRGLEPESTKGSITAKVGKFDKGWTVEAAIPLEDLGLKSGAVPKVWGINVCRQRPELGYEMPKAARDAGNKRFDPPMWKLDQPKSYRLPEYTAWAPTMAEFCGWPFYNDSRPFHFAERFGRAVLEVGTQEVAPPAKLFEVLFRSDFDGGQLGPFKNAAIADDGFRGAGKSLTLAPGKDRIEFNLPLEDLDDVTLLMTLKLKEQKLPVQHLSLTGKAPDGIWCGAERYEFFLTKEEAEPRTKFLDEYHKEKYGAGPFELYDTHADMVRWKPCGAVRKGPGPWAMVEGYFAEPSGGQVRWPGKDWVIVRIRLGQFRRAPQPKQGQRLVPREQGYPNGLVLGANPKDGLRIGDVVIYRGADTEPPAKVTGVKVQRDGDAVTLSWDKARDNTLTAFYRIYAAKTLVAETHQLTTRLQTAAAKDGPLTVVAVDLDGNASEPSEPVAVR